MIEGIFFFFASNLKVLLQDLKSTAIKFGWFSAVTETLMSTVFPIKASCSRSRRSAQFVLHILTNFLTKNKKTRKWFPPALVLFWAIRRHWAENTCPKLLTSNQTAGWGLSLIILCVRSNKDCEMGLAILHYCFINSLLVCGCHPSFLRPGGPALVGSMCNVCVLNKPWRDSGTVERRVK